jgi:hypothetical protein
VHVWAIVASSAAVSRTRVIVANEVIVSLTTVYAGPLVFQVAAPSHGPVLSGKRARQRGERYKTENPTARNSSYTFREKVLGGWGTTQGKLQNK